MSALRWLPIACFAWLYAGLSSCICAWLLLSAPAWAQDMSWVTSAMERSKAAQRENLPAWRYDPRVAAGNSDASLNSLAVITADRLVAVGDRGLILGSIDGGRSWHQQNSLTSLNLYDVTFVNEQVGVAVGGTIQPLSKTSVGLVLVTNDGGVSWQAIAESSQAPLPRLTGITRHDRVLRAWGDYSSAHQSGVFESQDQGRTWVPVPTPLGHMQAVACQPHGLCLGLDRAGRLGQVPLNPNREPSQLASPSSPVNSLRYTGQQWLAVGDNGTLTSSQDSVQWFNHPLPLSPAARDVCSFRCIAVFENNVWVAGSPGSILLNSPDAGKTWRILPLDQTWSIAAISFIDRNRGWLVTTAGSIWATRDGGTSWFAQRVPVKRLGMQALASSAGNISWPALANAAWQAKQATELIVVERNTPEDTVDFTPDQPATLSVLGTQIGLVSATNPGQWTSLNDASSQARLVNYLAMQLRMGRPTVVLVDDLAGAQANQEPFAEAVMQAMWLAENNTAATEWLRDQLHLPAWKATKLFSVTLANRADFTISAEELLRDSGLAMQDVLAPVFGKQSLTLPNTPIRCLQISSGNSASRQNLFAHHDKTPESTRAAELSKIGNIQLVMGRAPRDKAWQTLMPTSLNADEEISMWTKKLDAVIQQTPKHECGGMLLRLAEQCLIANRWERWYTCMQRVSGLVPHSDSTRHGALELLRLAASEEFLAWQAQSMADSDTNNHDQQPGMAQAAYPKALGNPQASTPFDSPSEVQPALATRPTGSMATVQAASAVAAIAPAEATRIAALRRAVSDFNQLAEADRTLGVRPDVLLAHHARRRALAESAGEPAPDAGPLQVLSSRTSLAGWPQVAAQEFVLAGGRGDRSTWTTRASRAAEAPYLNGMADDECWQRGTAIELVNPFLPPIVSNQQNRSLTQALFAYDDEFLYGYLACPDVTGTKPTSTTKEPRRYDMNLVGSDHVILFVDTDRDYASANELAINRAGHTYDRCCQYSQWNPRGWYVAVHESGTTWSAEFAIRLSDLTTRPPNPGSCWSISAFRHIPGWGVQSWSQLRTQSPQVQGNGLLMFE